MTVALFMAYRAELTTGFHSISGAFLEGQFIQKI